MRRRDPGRSGPGHGLIEASVAEGETSRGHLDARQARRITAWRPTTSSLRTPLDTRAPRSPRSRSRRSRPRPERRTRGSRCRTACPGRHASRSADTRERCRRRDRSKAEAEPTRTGTHRGYRRRDRASFPRSDRRSDRTRTRPGSTRSVSCRPRPVPCPRPCCRVRRRRCSPSRRCSSPTPLRSADHRAGARRRRRMRREPRRP
jgi:hypothetical protein